jgi:hypothetical protein
LGLWGGVSRGNYNVFLKPASNGHDAVVVIKKMALVVSITPLYVVFFVEFNFFGILACITS